MQYANGLSKPLKVTAIAKYTSLLCNLLNIMDLYCFIVQAPSYLTLCSHDSFSIL